MSELKILHQQLRQLLDTLETMTAQAAPDEVALASLRYRLTRTSTARRKLVESICLELEPRLTGKAAEQVRALRQSLSAGFASSSGHIITWSMAEVVQDWSGYCRASLEVRRAMRDQIERERIVLGRHIDC